MPNYEHAIPVTIDASLLVYSDKPRLTADDINQATDLAAITIGNDVMPLGDHQLSAELLGADPRGEVLTYETDAGDYDQYPYPEGTECADRVERVTPAMAAADDMLAEIKDALKLLDNVTAHTDNDSDCLGQAENALRRAIAKAEGQANE